MKNITKKSKAKFLSIMIFFCAMEFILPTMALGLEKDLKIDEIKNESVYKAYDAILEEYKDACSVSSNEWLADSAKYTTLYPNVNPYILQDYHTPSHYDPDFGDEPYEIGYCYYDIDKNGTQELILLMLHHEVQPFAIFAFDGTKAVELQMGEKDEYKSYGIYTNGTIVVYDSDYTVDYYRLNDDGYTVKNVILSQEDIKLLLSINEQI